MKFTLPIRTRLAEPRVRVAATARGARRAFTLIEILVVIAIVSLLAAILFPVFGQARENARRSTCQSNLKQIALGVTQYVQDYDERYPPLGIKFAGISFVNEYQLIYPYVKSTQVFRCPSDQTSVVPTYGGTAPSISIGLFVVGYAVNTRLSSSWASTTGGDTEVAGVAASSVPRPSGVVLMTDAGSNYSAVLPIEDWTEEGTCLFMDAMPPEVTTTVHSGSTNRCAPIIRHFDTSNVAFLDGHVKAMRPRDWYYANSPYVNPAVGVG